MASNDRLERRVIFVVAMCCGAEVQMMGMTDVDRLPILPDVLYTGRLKPSEWLRC